MPKVLVLKAPRRHVQKSFLAFFLPKFSRKRSHHVMDAAAEHSAKELSGPVRDTPHIAQCPFDQEPLNAHFLNGLFSRGFSSAKTAHQGIPKTAH